MIDGATSPADQTQAAQPAVKQQTLSSAGGAPELPMAEAPAPVTISNAGTAPEPIAPTPTDQLSMVALPSFSGGSQSVPNPAGGSPWPVQFDAVDHNPFAQSAGLYKV